MTDEDIDPEEALQQSGKRRTQTEPTAQSTDDSPDLVDAIADAFGEIDDPNGDINSTVGFRDERIAALLHGLEQSNRLSDVVEAAQDRLDRDGDADDPTRSQAASLLMRVGLANVDESLLAEGSEGYRQHLDRQAEEF